MTGPEKIYSPEEGCLRCLQYFDIFRYPLTAEEIWQFNPCPAGQEEINKALERLLDNGKVFRIKSYYSLVNNEARIEERLRGNARAAELLDKSRKYGSIIASFPFVKGIAVSGSLSKQYASEKADIDYFIITAAKRLWIARTLLHLYKKLTFLRGHQHYYCMNYFIDTEALEISHPNIYSAIETVTLLPLLNPGLIKAFGKSNIWTLEYLPNHQGISNYEYVLNEKNRPFKNILENFFNAFFPEKLNQLLMRFTDRKWRRKWARVNFPPEDYDQAFTTRLHISRNHPANYEKMVLESYLTQPVSASIA